MLHLYTNIALRATQDSNPDLRFKTSVPTPTDILLYHYSEIKNRSGTYSNGDFVAEILADVGSDF